MQRQSTTSADQRVIESLISARPIGYNPTLVRAVGSVTAGVFLAQLLYWRTRGADPDWIYKTRAEWEEETALGRFEQETARKRLKSLGILTEKRQGLPAQLYYHVHVDRLIALLRALPENAQHAAPNMETLPPTGRRPSRQLEGDHPANRMAGLSPTYNTESTPESTTERDGAPAPVRRMRDEAAPAPAALWSSALSALAGQMTAANFATWWADTRGQQIEGTTLVVQAPTRHAVDWLQTRCRPLARKTLRQLTPALQDVRFVVQPPP